MVEQSTTWEPSTSKIYGPDLKPTKQEALVEVFSMVSLKMKAAPLWGTPPSLHPRSNLRTTGPRCVEALICRRIVRVRRYPKTNNNFRMSLGEVRYPQTNVPTTPADTPTIYPIVTLNSLPQLTHHPVGTCQPPWVGVAASIRGTTETYLNISTQCSTVRETLCMPVT